MNDDTLHTRRRNESTLKEKNAAHTHRSTISVSFNGVSSGSFIAVDLFTFDVDLAKSHLIQFEHFQNSAIARAIAFASGGICTFTFSIFSSILLFVHSTT